MSPRLDAVEMTRMPSTGHFLIFAFPVVAAPLCTPRHITEYISVLPPSCSCWSRPARTWPTRVSRFCDGAYDRSQGSCVGPKGRFSAGQGADFKQKAGSLARCTQGHPEGRPGTVRQLACRSPLAAVSPLAGTGVIAPFWVPAQGGTPNSDLHAAPSLAWRVGH